MDKSKSSLVKSSFWQKIALVLFGLLAVFSLLELGLRLGGFIILSLQEQRNIRSIKKGGEYRILCLGESTTIGQYPPFLEEILNQGMPDIKFSVIDRGLSSTTTQVILGRVEADLKQYRPNIVVAMMGINDYGRHMPYEAASYSKTMRLIKSLRTYKLIRLIWLHLTKKIQSIYAHKISQDDKALASLGRFYRKEGKFSEAEAAFEKVIALTADNDLARAELGWIYFDQGKYSEAEQVFKELIEINPRHEGGWLSLGWAYHLQRKLSSAEQAFKKAIDINHGSAHGWLSLGWIYNEQNNLSSAEKAFRKAVTIEPNNEFAWVSLGCAYLARGDYSRAKELIEGLEFNPDSYRIYGILSLAYRITGDYQLAEEYARKADFLAMKYYLPSTVNNYLKLKQILDNRGVRLVCVQYPMRSIQPLKKIFRNTKGVIFVDNEKSFKEAVEKEGYKEYFKDMFGGDFGHCTDKGNRLLAKNIADAILKIIPPYK